MSGFDIDTYVSVTFASELEDDLQRERVISRRCLYAVAIVLAVVIARAVWFT